jgi:hypothetical protein
MLTTAVVAITVCGFATLFFWRFGHFRPRVAATLIALTWIVVPITWLIASAMTSRKWRKTSYVLSEDYLVVNKSSTFGGKKQRMYRYEAMISLRTEQSFGGKRHDYGTIHITMPRPEHEIVLPYVPDPERQAVFLKNQISSRRLHPHVESV